MDDSMYLIQGLKVIANPDDLVSPVTRTSTLSDDIFVEAVGRSAGYSVYNAPPPMGSGYTAAEASAEVSVLGKPFKFNPPLPMQSQPVRVEFDSNDPRKTLSEYFDERSINTGTKNYSDFQSLRLGRIVQDDSAAGAASTSDYRYGFRFLYNPTSIQTVSSRNDSVTLDRSSLVNAAVSGINQNFQTISFSLLLNRTADVIDGTRQEDYLPSISGEDLAGIRKYGTHWDLDYLYRLCNGSWSLKDRGKTSDIGMIIPSNARLMIGPGQNHFGFVESVSYTDLMFSRDMVPVRTSVQIVFRRHVDMAPSDAAIFTSTLGAGVSANTSYSTSLTPGSSVADFLLNLIRNGIAAGLGNLIRDLIPGGEGGGITGGGGVPSSGVGPGDTSPGNPNDAPIPGYRVTTVYGKRGRVWSCGWHTGQDYAAPQGTKIIATRAGTVVFAGTGNRPGWGTSYGKHVVVDTGGIRHLYAHLSSIGVSKGQQVAAGGYIGACGATGTTLGPDGSHLHYEERVAPYEYAANNRKPIWGRV